MQESKKAADSSFEDEESSAPESLYIEPEGGSDSEEESPEFIAAGEREEDIQDKIDRIQARLAVQPPSYGKRRYGLIFFSLLANLPLIGGLPVAAVQESRPLLFPPEKTEDDGFFKSLLKIAKSQAKKWFEANKPQDIQDKIDDVQARLAEEIPDYRTTFGKVSAFLLLQASQIRLGLPAAAAQESHSISSWEAKGLPDAKADNQRFGNYSTLYSCSIHEKSTDVEESKECPLPAGFYPHNRPHKVKKQPSAVASAAAPVSKEQRSLIKKKVKAYSGNQELINQLIAKYPLSPSQIRSHKIYIQQRIVQQKKAVSAELEKLDPEILGRILQSGERIYLTHPYFWYQNSDVLGKTPYTGFTSACHAIDGDVERLEAGIYINLFTYTAVEPLFNELEHLLITNRNSHAKGESRTLPYLDADSNIDKVKQKKFTKAVDKAFSRLKKFKNLYERWGYKGPPKGNKHFTFWQSIHELASKNFSLDVSPARPSYNEREAITILIGRSKGSLVTIPNLTGLGGELTVSIDQLKYDIYGVPIEATDGDQVFLSYVGQYHPKDNTPENRLKLFYLKVKRILNLYNAQSEGAYDFYVNAAAHKIPPEKSSSLAELPGPVRAFIAPELGAYLNDYLGLENYYPLAAAQSPQPVLEAEGGSVDEEVPRPRL